MADDRSTDPHKPIPRGPYPELTPHALALIPSETQLTTLDRHERRARTEPGAEDHTEVDE